MSDAGLFLAGWLGGAAVAALVQGAATRLSDWPAFDGRFAGPDAHMRLLRMVECRAGGCPDGVFPRSNAPFGEVLHWPHLLDWLILVLAAPLRLVQSWSEAVVTAGYLVGPVLALAALAVALIGARALVSRPAWAFAAVFLAAQFWVAWAFAPARPDHHGLQALFFLASVAFTARLLAGPPSGWVEWAVGVSVAGGLWVSVEGLVTVTVPLAVLGLRWLWSGDRDLAWSNARVFLWASLVLAVAVVLDSPEAGPWAVVYDRVSVAHLAMMLGATVLGAGLASVPSGAGVPGRAGAAFGGLIAVGALLSWFFPGLPRGPLTDVDPRIIPIWLDTVAEYVPLRERPNPSALIQALGPVLLALPFSVLAMVRAEGGRRWAWGLIGGCLIWFSLLGLIHGSRWAYYIQSIVPLAYCGILDALLRRASALANGLPRVAAQVAAVALMLVGPPLGIALAASRVNGSDPGVVVGSATASCDVDDLLPVLADPERVEPGSAILASVFWGPEILFHTDHTVVATPYHRNHEGILYSRDIMASTDDSTAARALGRRGIGYIALSRSGPWHPLLTGSGEGSLYRRLQASRPPDFLQEVALPDSVEQRCGLWRVTAR